MYIKYRLKKGETFKTVMTRYGIKDWSGVWNLKGNAALRRKRKYADKVTEGDELIVYNGKVKLHRVELSGKTYLIPASEWAAMSKKIVAEMNKKYLIPLGKMKKIYDDDYNYLHSIANDEGVLTGFFAALVENASGAKLPTSEMSKASADIRTLQKVILAGKFAEVKSAAQKAETSMNAYVKAAEAYRKKMTNGATKGVKVVKFVDDYAIAVAFALGTGGASAALAGTFTAIEVGAAMGAAAALIKTSSKEIGHGIAGEERSPGEIGFNIYTKMVIGGAEGAGSAIIVGKLGKHIIGPLSSKIAAALPKSVANLLAKEAGIVIERSLMSRLGAKIAIEKATRVATRVSLAVIKVRVKKYIAENPGALIDAFKAAVKAVGKSDNMSKLGAAIADELVKTDASKAIIRDIVVSKKKEINKSLEELDVDA